MTYSIAEMEAIIRRGPFAQSYSIEKIILAAVPDFIRISLYRDRATDEA